MDKNQKNTKENSEGNTTKNHNKTAEKKAPSKEKTKDWGKTKSEQSHMDVLSAKWKYHVGHCEAKKSNKATACSATTFAALTPKAYPVLCQPSKRATACADPAPGSWNTQKPVTGFTLQNGGLYQSRGATATNAYVPFETRIIASLDVEHTRFI